MGVVSILACEDCKKIVHLDKSFHYFSEDFNWDDFKKAFKSEYQMRFNFKAFQFLWRHTGHCVDFWDDCGWRFNGYIERVENYEEEDAYKESDNPTNIISEGEQ